jgi:hypothetical protein
MFAQTRAVEPEKQLLLANGSEITFVSRQRNDVVKSPAPKEGSHISFTLFLVKPERNPEAPDIFKLTSLCNIPL